MIDPLERVKHQEIEALIADKRYFLLHAPRQTGKTTTLRALMHHLNDQGKYHACYANIEDAQAARHDVVKGMRTVCAAIESSAKRFLGDDRLHGWTEEAWQAADATGALRGLLERWSSNSGRPIVLMLDEVDALVGDTLISLLRQIRAGYPERPRAFPLSIILCGVRDIQDYRIQTSHQEIITGGSAFNIKAKSLRLGNFTREETEALWRQHQDETGQKIDPAIWPELWEDTRGQPWLVNALGYEVTWEDQELRDRSKPITLERYMDGRERLIQSRATHLDQLTDKLKEERVRRIIMDIMEGETTQVNYPPDDLQYTEDLGLIVTRPQLHIANRIYQEVIPRELTWAKQVTVIHQPEWYVRADHRLDMPKLLNAFQEFFRDNAEDDPETLTKEASCQLLMQAFLQRIVNGDGRITREYAFGRRRTDLFLQWPLDKKARFHGPVQKVVIELKMLRKGLDVTLAKGLKQTAAYADKSGAEEAYLLVFDRRKERSWEERLWHRTENVEGRQIGVWGM